MIKEFIEKWDKYKNDLEDYFRYTEQIEYDEYEKIVKILFEKIINKDLEYDSERYDVEDLYQIGSLGFIKSIRRFDTSFDVQLSTYAVPYILGEIKRFIRDDGPIKVSRSTKELCVKIREVQNEFIRK